MKKALSVLIAIALLIGTCSPVLSVFAKNEPIEESKTISMQTPGKLADLLPEKAAKHELKKLEQSKAMWEVVTGPFSSKHKYADDFYYRWIYGNSDPNVTSIDITFSAETMVEWDYDFIEIYDDNDNSIGAYTGDQLAGKTIPIIGKGFTLVLYSDESENDYGFDVTAITPKSNSALSGTCGTSLLWSFDIPTGALDISGTGDMFDYDYYSVPWSTLRSYVLSVAIGTGATSLSAFAFTECYFLTTVTLGANLETIGELAFAYCYELTSVVIPNHVKIIGSGAFEDCAFLTSVIIGSSVETIGDFAFAWCYGLESINLPNSLISIGGYAFCESGISSVSLGNGLQTIGEYAFAGCYLLESVLLPSSLEELFEGAFIACESLSTVTIPRNVAYMGSLVFALCYSLEEILVDENNAAFCSQDGVLFDASETILVQYPSGKWSDEYFVLDGVETIGSGAFAGCMLSWIYFPESLTAIEGAAFLECSEISNIYIPSSVMTIGESAFAWCYSLYWVSIGYGVTYIGDTAFFGCENLNDAYFYGNAPAMGMSVFDWCGDWFAVYYIEGKLGFSDPWYDYSAYGMEGWIGVLGDGQDIDDVLPIKVKWNKSYKKTQLQLYFYSIVEDIADVEWESDNSKVVIDEDTGYITNLRSGARSANITITITDTNGSEYQRTVKVLFYKYNWQLKKLQDQSVVSDKYSQRNLSVEEYEKLEQDESADVMQYVLEIMNLVLSFFQKLAFS